ncbi:hypothetical protein PIROE2DRAFT_61369 [Piromyces sp. E2]|nr:hypothetical protein PIROE2DRAFT_61369 [Piromyces sp. E2]|eukprot:OUM63298.1 hypothetical protein PIROE2DRAFT_61369 [Piromyces sp. E2]
MTQVDKNNLFSNDSFFISFDEDDDNLKKEDSDLSIYNIVEELTISSTMILDNRITRSTQTINHEVADLKSVETLYNNLNKETLRNEHDKELTKIINEKNYYADETVRLKKIINDQNNKLFRLKYILVQKYPAKVKQLFSEKDADLNDILDPRDVQIESAMQHLQIDKMKKENEIRNLKKKLNKVKNDLSKKLEDETEYITVEKHKRIIKEIQEDYELSMSLLEKEKNKEINRLYTNSKKLKSIYEAQLLSLRKLQQKTNYNQVLERQNKILELSKVFFPKITRQSSNVINNQTETKEDKNTKNGNINDNTNPLQVSNNISLQENNRPLYTVNDLNNKGDRQLLFNGVGEVGQEFLAQQITVTKTQGLLVRTPLSQAYDYIYKQLLFIYPNMPAVLKMFLANLFSSPLGSIGTF